MVIMISYLDRAFCASKVKEHTCGRKFTEEHAKGARKWWGGDDYPVAYSNFCEEEKPERTMEEKETEAEAYND